MASAKRPAACRGMHVGLCAVFVSSDAWLLLTLIYCRDFADRQRLLQTGDAINHAIFTDEELEGGLARLQNAGYAVAEGDTYAPSATVLDWYASVTAGKSRTAIHKDLQRVTDFLEISDGV